MEKAAYLNFFLVLGRDGNKLLQLIQVLVIIKLVM